MRSSTMERSRYSGLRTSSLGSSARDGRATLQAIMEAVLDYQAKHQGVPLSVLRAACPSTAPAC
jgi:hypothetical protein